MRRTLFSVVAATIVALAAGGAAHAADERTATDGTRSLAVSAVRDLNPDGQAVDVQGSGYDTNKGIYLAFCVMPPKGVKPSPCSGGDDRDGASGGSIWISSNGINQAAGAKPYGPNGTFRFRLYLRAVINEDLDCRKTRCAVATRNDHTRGDDRSQDLFVPVTFRATSATTQPPAGAPTTTPPPPPTLPPTTTTTIAPELAAPTTTVALDNRSVSGGGKSLRASEVEELAPGATVTVNGAGFDTTRGIYVSLCAVPNRIDVAPDPCASGSAGAQAWISSNPPTYAKVLATPYGPGGSFEAKLTLSPLIDNEHDCRKITCAIAARNDDTHAGDRSQDLFLLVSFAKDTKTGSTGAARVVDDDSSNGGVIAAAVAGAVALAAAAAFVLRRSRMAR